MPTVAGDDGIELTNTGATAAAFTTIVRSAVVSAPCELVAVTLNVNVPVVVGVPDRTPAALSVSPVGNGPVDVVSVKVGAGLPLAVKV